MRKVQLGSTDLEVSAIAYGGMSLTPERSTWSINGASSCLSLVLTACPRMKSMPYPSHRSWTSSRRPAAQPPPASGHW